MHRWMNGLTGLVFLPGVSYEAGSLHRLCLGDDCGKQCKDRHVLSLLEQRALNRIFMHHETISTLFKKSVGGAKETSSYSENLRPHSITFLSILAPRYVLFAKDIV